MTDDLMRTGAEIDIAILEDGSVAGPAEEILCAAMVAKGHPFDFRKLSLTARAEGVPAGHLHAELFYGQLYISRLAVLEAFRGRGLGSALLLAAEAEGLRRGARSAYLGTWDIQAPRFYAKHGYAVFGHLAAAVPGQPSKFMMQKVLSA